MKVSKNVSIDIEQLNEVISYMESKEMSFSAAVCEALDIWLKVEKGKASFVILE